MGGGFSSQAKRTASQRARNSEAPIPDSALHQSASKFPTREIVFAQPLTGAAQKGSGSGSIAQRQSSAASLEAESPPKVSKMPQAMSEYRPAKTNAKTTKIYFDAKQNSMGPVVQLVIRKQNSPSSIERSLPLGDISFDLLTNFVQKTWSMSDYHLITENGDGDNVEIFNQVDLSSVLDSLTIKTSDRVLFYACTDLPKPAASQPKVQPETTPLPSDIKRSAEEERRIESEMDLVDAQELLEEKKETLYLKCLYEHESEVFCTVPADVSFWELLTRLRYAFGHTIYLCQRDGVEDIPIRTVEMFQDIVTKYQLSPDKYLFLIVNNDDEDEEKDELEHLLEEKRTTVFLRCLLNEEQVLDCSFPRDMQYSELWERLTSIYGTDIHAYALVNQKKIPIVDSESFNSLLKEYSKNSDRYFTIELSQQFFSESTSRPSTPLPLTPDVEGHIPLLCIINGSQTKMNLPPDCSYDQLCSRIFPMTMREFQVDGSLGDNLQMTRIRNDEDVRAFLRHYTRNRLIRLKLFVHLEVRCVLKSRIYRLAAD